MHIIYYKKTVCKENEFWEHLKTIVKDIAFSFGPKLIFATVTFIIGIFMIKLIRGIVMRLFKIAISYLKEKVAISLYYYSEAEMIYLL